MQAEEEMQFEGHLAPIQLRPDEEGKEYDEPLKEEPEELIISRPMKLSLGEDIAGLKVEKIIPEF